MKGKTKIISSLCLITVVALCSVNVTYAWENLEQRALNVTTGDETIFVPEEPEPTPPKPEEKPKPSEKPEKPDTSPKEDSSDQTGMESAQPSAGTVQTGKSDMTTGDVCEFLFYMVLMLGSIALMIVTGAVLIALLGHELEKRKSIYGR